MEARFVFTGRAQGDLAVGGEPVSLQRRRRSVPGVPDSPWTWLRQIHGSGAVTVGEPGGSAGAEADAAVTATAGVVLAVHTADCAPLVLIAPGAVAVVHAGWRGLVAGVVEATVDVMDRLGHPPQRAVLGPTIRPRCYEFGDHELDLVAARYGDSVRSTTAWGAPALDVAAGVRTALSARSIDLYDDGTCTACSPAHWSHRAAGDPERQAVVAWLEP